MLLQDGVCAAQRFGEEVAERFAFAGLQLAVRWVSDHSAFVTYGDSAAPTVQEIDEQQDDTCAQQAIGQKNDEATANVGTLRIGPDEEGVDSQKDAARDNESSPR